MPAMKFYMTPGSCSTGIHIILEELEEVFEAHIVNMPAGDHFQPAYVAINPKSTIPALVRRDGSVLTEVVAIAYWLARTHKRAKLWPDCADAESRALEVVAYVTGTLHGQGFARIFATGTFTKNQAEQAEVQALGRRIVENGFGLLDATMPAEGYVAGDFSVADPILFYVAFWADKTNIRLPGKIAAHYRRMLGRPVVQRVLREEGYNPAALGQSDDTGQGSFR
jgi:glutathione S-transferase